jgi:hypothetical protein
VTKLRFAAVLDVRWAIHPSYVEEALSLSDCASSTGRQTKRL